MTTAKQRIVVLDHCDQGFRLSTDSSDRHLLARRDRSDRRRDQCFYIDHEIDRPEENWDLLKIWGK